MLQILILGMFRGVETVFLLVFVLLMVIVLGIIVREKRKRKNVGSTPDANRSLTEKDFQSFSPPMIAQLIHGRGAYTRHITAGLLNLVRKRMLTLKEGKHGAVNYFSVEGAADKPTSLSDHYLLDWMLYEVGQDGVFYVDDLSFYTKDKDRRDQFIHCLYEWEEIMKLELENLGLLNKFPGYKRALLFLSIVMILLGSMFMFIGLPFLSVLYLGAGVATFIIMLSYSSMSIAGQVEAQKWKAFIDHLTTLPEKNIEEGQWLTPSYVYTIAFGLKDRYLKQFPIREASQLSLHDKRSPLYFAMAPGATAISLEDKNLVDHLEASLEQVVSPVAYSGESIQDEANDFTE